MRLSHWGIALLYRKLKSNILRFQKIVEMSWTPGRWSIKCLATADACLRGHLASVIWCLFHDISDLNWRLAIVYKHFDFAKWFWAFVSRLEALLQKQLGLRLPYTITYNTICSSYAKVCHLLQWQSGLLSYCVQERKRYEVCPRYTAHVR